MQRCVKVAAWVYGSGIAGHVSTEDVIYLLNGLGIDSDVDLDKLAETGVDNADYRQIELVEGGSGAGGEVAESLKTRSPKSVARTVYLNGVVIVNIQL